MNLWGKSVVGDSECCPKLHKIFLFDFRFFILFYFIYIFLHTRKLGNGNRLIAYGINRFLLAFRLFLISRIGRGLSFKGYLYSFCTLLFDSMKTNKKKYLCFRNFPSLGFYFAFSMTCLIFRLI